MRKQTKKWQTKSDGKIRICDMTDQHLLNTIKWMQRRAENVCSETALFYSSCPSPQGEIASYYVDQEADAAFRADPSDYLPDIYYSLMEDAERRGLDV